MSIDQAGGSRPIRLHPLGLRPLLERPMDGLGAVLGVDVTDVFAGATNRPAWRRRRDGGRGRRELLAQLRRGRLECLLELAHGAWSSSSSYAGSSHSMDV